MQARGFQVGFQFDLPSTERRVYGLGAGLTREGPVLRLALRSHVSQLGLELGDAVAHDGHACTLMTIFRPQPLHVPSGTFDTGKATCPQSVMYSISVRIQWQGV